MRRTQGAVSLCCIFLFILLHSPIAVSINIQDDLRYGPVLDKAVFKVFYPDEIAPSLQAGEIEIGSIQLSDFSTLNADPDIDIFESPRNGYQSILIDCDRYPLNISGFRRAFAFAFNKTKAVHEIYQGHASPHDSLLPSTSEWCVEDLFEHHY